MSKNLNRAYQQDKPYNDIALHLEKEMRFNGLSTPDKTVLVPLNLVDVAPGNKERVKSAGKLVSLWQ